MYCKQKKKCLYSSFQKKNYLLPLLFIEILLLICTSVRPVGAGTVMYDSGFSVSSVSRAYQHLMEVMDKYHDSFYVYYDNDAGGNHFYPSGWMGDAPSITFDSNNIKNIHSGTSCIKITFKSTSNNWAGIYWQEPENNWGTVKNAGYDLSGATKLSFRARGKKGNEVVEFFAGGITGSHPDSFKKTSTGKITLTDYWKKYTINVGTKDLSNVIGGFGLTLDGAKNTDGAVFYLDDIKYNVSRDEEYRFLNSFETLSSENPDDPDRYITNACYIYDNALALLAFLARGNNADMERARILAKSFLFAQENDRYYYGSNFDGRLRNAYMSGDLADHITGRARLPGWWDFDEEEWFEDKFQVSTHTGNMAWVMIALLQYYDTAGGEEYPDAVKTLGEWIEENTKNTDGYGGYTAGYEGWEGEQEKLLWKSTEHNIDVYVAFMRLFEITGDTKWEEGASYAKHFVESMWNDNEKHFWTGTDTEENINTENIPIDIQAWAIMALNDYHSALVWSEANCFTESDGFSGFDFNNDRDGVWFEGTAQMAIAYQINEESDKSDFYISELKNAQLYATNTNERGIVAASHDDISTGFDWEYFSRLHVGATAWYLFAGQSYNPYWGTFITTAQQTEGEISGAVTDNSDSPVKAAKLTLRNKTKGNYGKKDIVFTDDSGFYEFKDLKKGRYKLTVKKNGYEKWKKKFGLEKGEKKELQIKLSQKE